MIIWGKKIVRNHLGYAADFCPVCACARPFALSRLGVAGHLYYIAVGEGDLAGYERACMVCTVALKAEPTQYAEVATRPTEIRDLIKQTFPNLAQAYRGRLMQEQAIKLDPTMLDAADRQSLLMEPFMLLSVKVSERFENTPFSGNKAFLKREVLPVLALALRRLRPSDAELNAALARLIQMKEPIGAKIKLADLVAEIKRPAFKAAAMAYSDARGQAPVMVGDEANGRIRAGKLMRWLSILTSVAVLGLALMTLLPGEVKQSPNALRVILALAALVAFVVYRASSAVRHGLAWGRHVGIVFGVMLLFVFPVGSVLGAYLLWCLVRKWSVAGGSVSAQTI